MILPKQLVDSTKLKEWVRLKMKVMKWDSKYEVFKVRRWKINGERQQWRKQRIVFGMKIKDERWRILKKSMEITAKKKTLNYKLYRSFNGKMKVKEGIKRKRKKESVWWENLGHGDALLFITKTWSIKEESSLPHHRHHSHSPTNHIQSFFPLFPFF